MSDAFLARWGDHTEPGRTGLVEIVLSSPTARTIRLATRPTWTPDGNVWEPLITAMGPVEATTTLLSGGPDLAVCDVQVARTAMSWQAAGYSFADAFYDYEWVGATATVYLWVQGLPNWSDAQPALKNARVTGYETTESGCVIHLKQQTVWNAQFPDIQITKKKFPSAPESSINAYVPIMLGDRRTDAYPVPPYSAAYGQVTPGTMVSGGVVTDTGKDTGVVSVMFASHPLKMFGGANTTNGSKIFMRGGDILSVVEQSRVTLVNDSTGTRMDINLGNLKAWAGVLPVDVRREWTTADNATNALDFLNPRSYASVAYNERLQLILPNASSLGSYDVPVYVLMAYSTSVGAGYVRVEPKNPSNDGLPTHAGSMQVTQTSGHVDVRIGVGVWPSPSSASNDDLFKPPDQWNFGGGTNSTWNIVDMGIKLVSAGAGSTLRVYWACLLVFYTPSFNVLVPGYKGPSGQMYDLQGRRVSRPTPGTGAFYRLASLGMRQELNADFFCTAQGWADDVSGTYTGSADSVIVRPPDIAAFLLNYYGDVALSDIERTASTFGSLVDARVHRTLSGRLMSVARTFREETDLAEAISSLASECAALWFINRLTGKHSWLRWDQDATTTYTRKLSRPDLLKDRISIERASDSRAVNSVQVDYGDDHYRGRGIHTCLIAPGDSTGGWSQDDQRDQFMTVTTGVNDKINFKTSGGELTATLAAGDYTGRTLVQEVRSKMDAATSGDLKVEYGGEVVTGFNDDLPVADSANTLHNLKLTSGSYTMDQLAAHVKAVLDAGIPGQTWTVTYQTTRIFRIDSNANFKMKWATNVTTHCGALLGEMNWTNDTTAATAWAAVFERGNETFHISRALTLELLSNSGTNFSTSAYTLLGYDTIADYTGFYAYTAPMRRAARERQATASRTLNGPKRPLRIDSKWINSTEMALDLRDRTFDWFVDQPFPIRFATLRMPDIERGMVFEVDSTLDAVSPYPRAATSRSWAGRRFMVTEVRQSFGDSWHQEIVATEINRNVLLGDGEAGSGVTPPSPPIAPTIGTGAVVVVWQDKRSLDNNLYMQTLAITDGAPYLVANGVPINNLSLPVNNSAKWMDRFKAVDDVSGYSYIVWVDASLDIRAQKFTSDGSKLWNADGVLVCNATGVGDGSQIEPRFCLDDAGGIVVAWSDNRGSNQDIYAQRVTSAGAVAWTANGVVICTASTNQAHPDVVRDGSGGAIIVWDDLRAGVSDKNIYAQRILNSGTVAWTANGIAVCAATGHQTYPRAVEDSGGGAVVVWRDERAGASDVNLYTARVKSDGTLPWTADGVAVTTATGNQQTHAIVSDGAGGAIVAWYDARSGNALYAQRILTGGTMSWTANGVQVWSSTRAPGSEPPAICMDGSSGCLIVGTDGSDDQMKAFHLNASGVEQYGSGSGVEIRATSVAGTARSPSISPNATGRYVIAWEDSRNSGTATQVNIYAQQLSSGQVQWATNGVRVTDVANEQNEAIVLALTAPISQTERIVIDSTNQWIDTNAAGAYEVSVTTGTYTYPELAEKCQLALNSGTIYGPGGSAYYYRCGWGTYVRTGHNDTFALDLYDGSAYTGSRTTTLAEADYTPESLASALSAALNVTFADKSALWQVIYSTVTATFEVRCNFKFQMGTGTNGLGWSMLGGTPTSADGVATQQNGYWSLLGSAAFNYPAERYYHTFWLRGSNTATNWKWATGTHTATGIHRTLGFAVVDSGGVGDTTAAVRVG